MIKNTPTRNRAIIHFMASTGARIGVFNYPLQMKHLRDVGNGCMSVLIYADEPEEYWAFLTPEATDAIKVYHDQRLQDHEKFYPETPIFRTVYQIGIQKAIPLSGKGANNAIERIVKKSEVKRTKVGSNYDISLEHGFRKRFNIILKLNNEVNSNIAEKILGHSVTIPLDGVYLPSGDPRVIEKCFEEFKKAIPELTVDGTARKQAELDQANKEKSQLQEKVDEIEEMKRQQADENARRDQALEYLMRKEKERERNPK